MMNWKWLILFTVVSWATYNVILKAISGRLAWQLSMLMFVIGYSAAVGVFCSLNLGATFSNISTKAIMWPVICGIFCGLGAITFFKAIPLTSGSILMPLVGMYVPLSAIACMVFLGEPVSIRAIVGIICAGAAVVLLS